MGRGEESRAPGYRDHSSGVWDRMFIWEASGDFLERWDPPRSWRGE